MEREQRPAGGERQPQGIPPLEVWIMEKINQAKQQLGEGESIDPWFVSDLFLTYHERVTARMMQIHGTDKPETLFETRTPEEEGFVRSIFRIRDAFAIVAYPDYNIDQQKLISDEVHRHHVKSQKPFTLKTREKATLQSITRAIGLADNPHQLTYSFSSIPLPPKIVRGSTG